MLEIARPDLDSKAYMYYCKYNKRTIMGMPQSIVEQVVTLLILLILTKRHTFTWMKLIVLVTIKNIYHETY